jgi:isoleucyl-tRNA synthetase
VLFTCLEAVCRSAASLLPLVTEEIWRGLTGGRSVHLAEWPDAGMFPAKADLVTRMESTRIICSAGSSLRKAANLRVRLPLSELTVVAAGAEELAGGYEDIIKDELNIKSVRLIDAGTASPEEFGIEQKLVVNARAAGPRLGKDVQTAIKASKSGDWSVDDAGMVTAGGLELQPQEYTLETVVTDSAGGGSASVAVLPGGGFVVLNTEVTPDLEAEGVARDFVRTIQQARKDADLVVSDRIRTTVSAEQAVLDALGTHESLVSEETLTVELVLVPSDNGQEVTVEKVEGKS